jgi:hypothetical protein
LQNAISIGLGDPQPPVAQIQGCAANPEICEAVTTIIQGTVRNLASLLRFIAAGEIAKH